MSDDHKILIGKAWGGVLPFLASGSGSGPRTGRDLDLAGEHEGLLALCDVGEDGVNLQREAEVEREQRQQKRVRQVAMTSTDTQTKQCWCKDHAHEQGRGREKSARLLGVSRKQKKKTPMHVLRGCWAFLETERDMCVYS